MILLTKVEEVFEIEGRGCVLVPAISDSAPKDLVIRRADSIVLHKPDGSAVQTHIEAIEMIDFLDRTKSSAAIVLPLGFSKRDIPVGTEVWLAKA